MAGSTAQVNEPSVPEAGELLVQTEGQMVLGGKRILVRVPTIWRLFGSPWRRRMVTGYLNVSKSVRRNGIRRVIPG
jgi:hypothetical protein